MPAPKKAAVITGDVINSSALEAVARRKMNGILNRFEKDSATGLVIQQYRGDSIQSLLTTRPELALRLGLQLQSRLMASGFRIRIAIGIGDYSFKGHDIITSDGSAFRASGLYLDTLKKTGDIISVAGEDADFTGEWQTHSASLNYIVKDWTALQAEVVDLQLAGYTQQQTARKLKITQPSVHQRLQAAGWSVIIKIVERFESVVPQL